MLRHTLLAAVVVACTATVAESGSPHCSRCGCCQVRKVCVPVQEIIKETTYEYACECEDFCVPGPSKCVGTKCVPDCQGCPHCVKVWQPTCGDVYTRTKLIKIPVEKEKCVTKWVVKTVCCSCGHSCGCGGCTEGCGPGCTACAEPTSAPLPPPDAPAAPQASTLLPPPPPAGPAPMPAVPHPAALETTDQSTSLPSKLFR